MYEKYNVACYVIANNDRAIDLCVSLRPDDIRYPKINRNLFTLPMQRNWLARVLLQQ
jgi:hypothetical protein